MVWLLPGEDPPVAAPVPVVSASAVPEEAPAEAPTPEPSQTPAETTPPPPPARPADLVAGLMTVVTALEQRGELDDGDAKSLNRRLEQLAERLDRDPDEAAGKLEDFAEKLADLREDDDISQAGFDALAAGATQLTALIPAERDD
ncbi:FIMAH domain-containing protein [Actinoplanes sp. GCM10030250]|uniref:FIMAH domain-containing protein n=1 Tax=Actinoplanes sp. GCM10030250 TaxID=3273376 RepID=UPI003607D2B5